jgi:NADH-quinone oxidoreductase subunit L
MGTDEFWPDRKHRAHFARSRKILDVISRKLVWFIALAFLGVRAMASTGQDPANRLGPAVVEQSDRGFGFDAVYVAVGRAVIAVARLVVRLDRDVVDAYPRGAASLTGIAGRVGERAHRAAPSAGLLAVVVGVVLIAVAGVTVWH